MSIGEPSNCLAIIDVTGELNRATRPPRLTGSGRIEQGRDILTDAMFGDPAMVGCRRADSFLDRHTKTFCACTASLSEIGLFIVCTNKPSPTDIVAWTDAGVDSTPTGIIPKEVCKEKILIFE